MASDIFITLEGGEGAGKTTHLATVTQWFEARGHSVVSTREPGGTALGERIRALLLDCAIDMAADTELLLLFAARAEHVARVVRPALAAGKVVVCDRFIDASYAYQGGGRGIAAERIRVLEHWTLAGLAPTLTLLFDVPVAEGMRRAGARGELDRFERERTDFQERVRTGYRARAAAEPVRIATIDAAQSLASVTQQIQAVLARRWP